MTPPSLHFHAPTLPSHDAAHLSTMSHFSIRFAAVPCFRLQHAAMIRERDNAAGQYLNAGGGRRRKMREGSKQLQAWRSHLNTAQLCPGAAVPHLRTRKK